MVSSKETKTKKIYKGRVVSDKMDKTIVVSFDQTYTHPQLRKVLKRSKKYKVHDEQNVAKLGDVVEFYQVRPLSRDKYMSLHRVVVVAQSIEEV
jgi:small subunit ribosomal protein S17